LNWIRDTQFGISSCDTCQRTGFLPPVLGHLQSLFSK
jgi:hypothetical protein